MAVDLTFIPEMLIYPRSMNNFIWSAALRLHATCTNFGGLLVVRAVLSMCEGAVTAGFMIITSMFYKRTEQMSHAGWWCTRDGIPEARTDSCYTRMRRSHGWNRLHSPQLRFLWRLTHSVRSSCAVTMVSLLAHLHTCFAELNNLLTVQKVHDNNRWHDLFCIYSLLALCLPSFQEYATVSDSAPHGYE